MAIPKHITVVVAGSGDTKDIEITQGVTAGQVINEAGLEGYNLSKVGASAPFQATDDLYSQVDNHEKIYATPANVEVGISSVPAVRIISSPSVVISNRKVLVIKNGKFDPDKEITLICNGKDMPYWEEQGWVKNGEDYQGSYHTQYGNWKGVISEEYSGSFNFYIYDPPPVVRKNTHWPCFRHKGKEKYFVHFASKPKDISTGIIHIEKIISESFQKYEKNINGGKDKCRQSFLSKLLSI